jgi:superfamily II DNA or RNA helicase
LVFVDEVTAQPPRETGPWQSLELRPYQKDALLAWNVAGRRGVTVLPTGSGKTRLALAALALTRVPALCLVPTRVLLRQWIDELRVAYGGAVGCLGDGDHALADVCVATFESAYRYMPYIGRRFGMVVIDEVHHFGGGIRDEALEMCAAAFRLGLTATPPPEVAALRLDVMVGPIVFELGVADLTGRWLAELDRVVLRLPLDPEERRCYANELRRFRAVYREFQRHQPTGSWRDFALFARASAEGRAALSAWRHARRMLGLTQAKRAVVRELLARHHDSRVLVFTADNDAAYAIAREQLVMPITCHVSRGERAAALESFRSGELRALVSARVLNEGIDVPDADVAIIVAGAHGEREYVQRIGRLLRPRPGKRALVYELMTVGTSEARHSVQRRWRLATRSARQIRR